MSNKTLFVIWLLYISGCSQSNSKGWNNIETNKDKFTFQAQAQKVSDANIGLKMDKKVFWQIIDKAYQESNGNERMQEASLIKQLSLYPVEDIIAFERIMRQTLAEADDYKAIAALKIIQGWVTDDTYLYFRCWLVGQGQRTFTEALHNPEYLVDKCEKGEFPDFESLLYVADEAYMAKTGKGHEDANLPREVVYKEGVDYDTYAPPTKGEEIPIDQLPALYPKLWKKFK